MPTSRWATARTSGTTPPQRKCPVQPALITSFGPTGSDGLLTFKEIFDLRLDADIVIGHSLTGDVPRGAEHLHTRVLAREPIDVALPSEHPLAHLDHLVPGDLLGTTWVGVPVGYPFDSILIAVENATSTNLDRVQRLRDNRLVEALVATGTGLALLPRFTTRPRPGVVLRPLDGVRSVRSIVAIARPDRQARFAVRTVLDHLTAAGADLEAEFAEVDPPRP